MSNSRYRLLSCAWQQLLDGDRPWGSIDVRPDRFGVTRYRLVVYPPGISEAERRRVRVARGFPLWGAAVWIVAQIYLSNVLNPWVALALSMRSLCRSASHSRWGWSRQRCRDHCAHRSER